MFINELTEQWLFHYLHVIDVDSTALFLDLSFYLWSLGLWCPCGSRIQIVPQVSGEPYFWKMAHINAHGSVELQGYCEKHCVGLSLFLIGWWVRVNCSVSLVPHRFRTIDSGDAWVWVFCTHTHSTVGQSEPVFIQIPMLCHGHARFRLLWFRHINYFVRFGIKVRVSVRTLAL